MIATADIAAEGESPNAATPAGKLNTPTPTIPLTKLKIAVDKDDLDISSPPPLEDTTTLLFTLFVTVSFLWVVEVVVRREEEDDLGTTEMTLDRMIRFASMVDMEHDEISSAAVTNFIIVSNYFIFQFVVLRFFFAFISCCYLFILLFK